MAFGTMLGGLPRIAPHKVLPGVLTTRYQPTQAFNLLGGRQVQQMLDEATMYLYKGKLDFRFGVDTMNDDINKIIAAPQISSGQIQTIVYKLSLNTVITDEEEVILNETHNVSYRNAVELSIRQAFLQKMRDGLLYGFNGSLSEGLLAQAGNVSSIVNWSTTTPLALVKSLLTNITNLKTRMNLVSAGVPVKILMPSKYFSFLTSVGIVASTDFLVAGSAQVAGKTVEGILNSAYGDNVYMGVDDTLLGKGQTAGQDAIIMTVPESPKLVEDAPLNALGDDDTVAMFSNTAAPTFEYVNQPQLRQNVYAFWRCTPGWVFRKEAIMRLNVTY